MKLFIMKSINFKLFFLVAIFFIDSFGKNEVDLVVINAKIYTVDNNFSIAKSMAIKNGQIVDIDVKNLDSKYTSTKIIDLNGETIIPGIIDSHCHFYNLGLDQQVVNLRETKSFDEIIQRLKNYELKNETNVILGRGWDQNDWDKKSFPVNTKLNDEFGDKLVVLERIDGHAYIVNDNVLELAGIDKNTLVRGGLVLLKDNKPTGVLIDGPMSLVDKVLPEKSLNENITTENHYL